MFWRAAEPRREGGDLLERRKVAEVYLVPGQGLDGDGGQFFDQPQVAAAEPASLPDRFRGGAVRRGGRAEQLGVPSTAIRPPLPAHMTVGAGIYRNHVSKRAPRASKPAILAS